MKVWKHINGFWIDFRDDPMYVTAKQFCLLLLFASWSSLSAATMLVAWPGRADQFVSAVRRFDTGLPPDTALVIASMGAVMGVSVLYVMLYCLTRIVEDWTFTVVAFVMAYCILGNQTYFAGVIMGLWIMIRFAIVVSQEVFRAGRFLTDWAIRLRLRKQ